MRDYPASGAAARAGCGFGFFGGGYVVQKLRPHAAHFQNCWGGHGWPGAGSRSSMSCPHRWQRIRMSTLPLLMWQILGACAAERNGGRSAAQAPGAVGLGRNPEPARRFGALVRAPAVGRARGRRPSGYDRGVIVPGLILTGGRSARMGQPKALLPVDARDTFVSRLVRTLREAGVDDLVVVAAGDGPIDAIRGALAATPPEPRVVLNPDPSRGQLSSLLTGLEALDRPGMDALLVTLVDMPLVGVPTVRALLGAYARTRAPIVRPMRPGDSAHGHPVVFDRSVFDALRDADPQAGAKPVVRALEAAIENVPVDDPGAFLDVDTPAEYRRVFGRPVPASVPPR